MALKLTIPPDVEPISLDEAKAHLRVDTSEDDELISSLITAAREFAEGFQNRSYTTQTWDLWLDHWPSKGYISTPRPPLQYISSIKCYSPDNTEYTINPADYFADSKSEPGRVILAYGKCWPPVELRRANGIVVTFVGGYGEPTQVPKKMLLAMKLLIGFWYENREAAVTGAVSRELEFTVHSLLWQDRVVEF